MQDISKQQFFIGAGAITIIVVGLAAWYFLDLGSTSSPSNTNGSVIDLSQGATTTDKYTVELVPSGNLSAAPSLERAVPSTSPDLEAAVRAQLITNIQATITRLKANSDSYNDWMLLGVQRQMLGDYQGAVEAWDYMTERAPNDATAYGNLANLYAVYLKDYSRAEANYKAAISRGPGVMSYYTNLHEVYRYNLKDSKKATDVLKQGIQKISKEVSLYIMLARYYKDLGETENARAEYDASLSLAAGNSALIADLQAERNSL